MVLYMSMSRIDFCDGTLHMYLLELSNHGANPGPTPSARAMVAYMLELKLYLLLVFFHCHHP